MSKKTKAHIPALICFLIAMLCYILDFVEVTAGLILLGFIFEIIAYVLAFSSRDQKQED